MTYLFVALITAMPLSCGELLTRLLNLHRVAARKFVHVLGALVAVLLVILFSRRDIALVVPLFSLLMVLVRRYLSGTIHSLYEVQHDSYGELWFPLGVGGAAALATSDRGYILAMLILGFSDTAAALIGRHFPWLPYRLLGATRTVSGSLAFAAVSLLCCKLMDVALLQSFELAVGATFAEMIGNKGADNASVPLAVVLLFVSGSG